MVNVAVAYREVETQDPDRRIAEEAVNGNPQAYNQLVERYWGRIFSRVYALLNSREDAEEITQDAFTKAYENLAKFRWDASFSTWLYRIASNLARNRYWYWKRRGRGFDRSLDAPLGDGDLLLQDVVPCAEADPADRLRWSEFQEQIETHLGRLPEQHRQIMELRLLDHLSYEDISVELEIPLGTVKSRIARARTHLTRSIGLSSDQNVQAFALELGRVRS